MLRLALTIGIAAVLIAPGSVWSGSEPLQSSLGSWVATGTIAGITGPTVSVLMKDGRAYDISAGNAQVVVGARISNYLALRVSDTVKVMGTKTGPTAVRADRIVVLPQAAPGPAAAQPKPAPAVEPPRSIEIYGEETLSAAPPEYLPAEEYAPPPVERRIKPPKPPAPPITYTVRGLVTDVRYMAQSVTVQTSKGSLVIDISPADIRYAGRPAGIGVLDPGDAVEVAGELGANRAMTAARVTVLMRPQTARQATDVQRMSISGDIASIDYPSGTFVLRGGATRSLIMADDHTVIRDAKKTYSITDLGPETRVKVTAFGSQSTGYVAEEVFVVGLASPYAAVP
ncbi:MAG: hypothetical protein Q7T82_06380 [Armatimonadota bacterium]|nr:hypothetical protein [Armatimonadota bacterium]